MKRTLFILAMVLCLALTVALTACTPSYKLELYDADGKTLLQTITVKEGEAPKRPENPTKDGMAFDDWYITPTNQTKYDFSKPLTEDAKAYARWKTASYDDTRDWVLVGDMNSWAAKNGYHFEKSGSTGNVFTLTCDVELGDAFKATVLNSDGSLDYNNPTGANVGFALLQNPGENFSGGEGLGDAPKNILCAKPGNYTFTLTTDPVNNNNSISFVRNGDVVGGGDEDPVIMFYLKGEKVTDWKDLIAETTTLAETQTEGQYKLEIYLPQDDKVMFASVKTENGTTVDAKKYIKYVNLDDSAKELFTDASGNMQTKAAGKYTFVYDTTKSEKNLSVTVDTTATLVAADLYLDGTFDSELENWNGYCFNAKYKLTQDAEKPWLYTIDSVALAADKEMCVQMFKAGATDRGEWGTDSYNGLGSIQFRHMYNAGENFEAASKSNNNIKILHGSRYKITVNLLSKMITAEDLDIPDDACLHGLFEGASDWANGEKFTWDADAETYTLTVELKVNETFGIKILVGNTTAQRAWIGTSAVTGTVPAGIDVTGGNFLVKTAGTYTFVVDMSGDAPAVTITEAPAAAE